MKFALHHVPGFRSSRPLLLYHELQEAYGDSIPQLEIVQYDQHDFRINKSERLLKLNPNGKVPVLEHGDISMWDGTAICLYLLDTFDKEHIVAPKDGAFRAIFYQYAFYVSGTVDNLGATSSPIQRVHTNLKPGDEPDEVARNAIAWEQVVGPMLSRELGDKEFFIGDRFTALDCIIMYNFMMLDKKRPGWIQLFPNLDQFLQRSKKRKSFQTVLGFLYAPTGPILT